MRRFRAFALIAMATVVAVPAHAAAPAPSLIKVLGNVTNAARPVSNALVIALNLDDLSATQVWTAADGSFRMPSLRSSIYKVIAVKQGFLPAITTVLPTRSDHNLALKLESNKGHAKSANQEIWELRGSLPPDVPRRRWACRGGSVSRGRSAFAETCSASRIRTTRRCSARRSRSRA